MIEPLITKHLDLWTGAVTQKATRGRGSNGKVELTGVKKLRELILGMAVQGKLTTRGASDEPASDLLQRVLARQTQLYTQGKIKKRKKLPSVSVEERYFHLPVNWEWTRLGILFDSIMSGGTPSKRNPCFWDGDIPWASVKDLGKTKHLDKTQDYITEEGLKAGSKLADTGDILICTRMGLGKVAICSKPIAINQDLKAVKISPEVSLDYFFLAYTTLDITGTGTTVAGITQDKLLNYVIGLPPIEEQHRIVQKVDELMALCDRLEQQTSDQLEAHETLVGTLLGTLTQSESATELADNWARLAAHFDTLFTTEQSIDKLKQTILQLAVTGKLSSHDLNDKLASESLKESFGTSNEMKEVSKKSLPPVKLEERPYKLPLTWTWARLPDITFFQEGPGILAKDFRQEGVPLIRIAGMHQGSLSLKGCNYLDNKMVDKKWDHFRLELGDIILSSSASLGKVAKVGQDTVGAVVYTGLIRFQPSECLFDDFLVYFLNSNEFLRQINDSKTGAAIKHFGPTHLKKMVVPLPPLNEQHRIVQKVDELMALCDQLKEQLNQASETRNQLAEAVVEGALG